MGNVEKEIQRIEAEIAEIRNTKLKIWRSSTERNVRRTHMGLDACNAKIYELNKKLREVKKAKEDEDGRAEQSLAREDI